MPDIKQLNEMNVGTISATYQRIIKKLVKDGYKILEIHPINKNRYFLIRTNKEKFLIAFKREVFYNFGSKFRSQGYKGVGDSLNRDEVKLSVAFGVNTILTTFPNGHTYAISMKEFLEKAILWTNKEGKQVYSISIHDFKLWNEI